MSDDIFYECPRLKKEMERVSGFPLSFIVGGTGYGKSALARRFLSYHEDKSLYFLFTGHDLSAHVETVVALVLKK